MRIYIVLILISLLISSATLLGQEVNINNFIIQEDVFKNDKIAVLAADPNDTPKDNINGTFAFSINGFKEELQFANSTARISRQIDKSAFVYIKHVNESGTHAKLYYILKREKGLSTFEINWLVLLVIPAMLVVLGMLFRKFILIALILIGLLVYFNYSNGLDVSTFFETIYNGILSIF